MCAAPLPTDKNARSFLCNSSLALCALCARTDPHTLLLRCRPDQQLVDTTMAVAAVEVVTAAVAHPVMQQKLLDNTHESANVQMFYCCTAALFTVFALDMLMHILVAGGGRCHVMYRDVLVPTWLTLFWCSPD